MEDFNTKKLRAIAFYTVLTAAAILGIYQLLNNFPAVMERLHLFYETLMAVLMPIILGFIFAYLLNPSITWYERQLIKNKRTFIIKRARGISVVASLLSVAFVFTVIGSLLVSSVTKEL